jgi:hypothetical protein
MDLSPVFSRAEGLVNDPALTGNLRALRDSYKFRLTYVVATRQPLPGPTELSELFYAHTLWLGPLNKDDARWNISRFAERKGLAWDIESVAPRIITVSGGYPSFLRAVCEAHAEGAELETDSLARHPSVRRRIEEFWAEEPSADALHQSGLEGLALLRQGRASRFDTAGLS